MSSTRDSFFPPPNLGLSDDQIDAASLYWLRQLKSRLYSADTRAKNPSGRIFVAQQNKAVLLNELAQQQANWENDLLDGLKKVLTEHRKDPYISLSTDYEAEELLEEAVAKSVPMLAKKNSIFPIKVYMKFDNSNNMIVNERFISADTYLTEAEVVKYPRDVFAKLGCPRFLPTIRKLFC
jgi:hypothetical protein